jgi:hypothetical protein
MEKTKKVVNTRKFYTFFIVIMPSILLAILGTIEDIFTRVLLQMLTFALQIVVVKGILDDFYDN